MRNGLALEDAPLDEVNVFVEHFVEIGQFGEPAGLTGTQGDGLELGERGVGLGTEGGGLVKVNAGGLLLAVRFVLAASSADVAEHPHLVLETGED